MKKFLALVLALVMTMSLVTIGASAADDGFKDADKINNTEAVEVLSAMGVIGGYGDGTFRPQATLTRGAGAKFVAYLVLGQEKADALKATYTVFSDVDDSVGLAAYIEWAAAAGIVQGYGDGRFGPYDTLTQYAFGKMLLAALGYDAEEEGYVGAGWQKNVYADAFAAGIYDGTESYTSCDRETAARFALGALKAEIVAYGKLSNIWFSGSINTLSPDSSTHGFSAGLLNALLSNFGIFSAEGAVGTGYALWENYEDLDYYDDKEQDIFGRPGHAWTYGDDFEKFYMDEAVAEYTEEVSACDVLVDCGYAKTKSTKVKVEFYVDGEQRSDKLEDGDDEVSHNTNCDGTFGGQGTLTQVFKTDTNQYLVTEIHTFLGEVESVQTKTHSKKGESELDVWYAEHEASTKALSTAYDVTVNDAVDYDKDDYVLVQYGAVPTSTKSHRSGNIWAVEDQYDADVYGIVDQTKTKLKDVSLVIVGEPSVIESAKFSGVAADKSQATVNGNRENTNYMYSLSDSKLDRDNYGTYHFFVDQYGNIIGDIDPEDIYTYGVIDTILWVSGTTALNNDGHATLSFFTCANTDGEEITLKKYDGEKPADAKGDDGDIESDGTPLVSQYPSANADAYTSFESANLGVVKYKGDGKFVTVPELDKDGNGLETVKKNENADIVKGSHKITNSNSKVVAQVNNSTLFLVRTEKNDKNVYAAYTGKNEVPSISGASVVAVIEDDDTYASFVFVDATSAVMDGETVTVYYPGDGNWEYDEQYDDEHYTVYLNGEEKVLMVDENQAAAVSAALANGAGFYKLGFDNGGKIVSAAKDTSYVEYTAAEEVVGGDLKVTKSNGNEKVYSVDGATVYGIELDSATDSASTFYDVLTDIDLSDIYVYEGVKLWIKDNADVYADYGYNQAQVIYVAVEHD